MPPKVDVDAIFAQIPEPFVLPKLEGKASFGFVDALAYIGGLWFFLGCMFVGPMVRNFISGPLFVAEIGQLLFYRQPGDTFSPDKRVKKGVKEGVTQEKLEEMMQEVFDARE